MWLVKRMMIKIFRGIDLQTRNRVDQHLSYTDSRKHGSNKASVALCLLGGTSAFVTVIIAIIFGFFLVMTSAGCSKSSKSYPDKEELPCHGTGLYEVIIFTDYFCPSCQTLESELEPILNELIENGVAKIAFVDAPVHKLTQQYGKYFLYSVNAGADFKDVLKIRRVLFSLAKTNAASTEESIASELRARGIALQPYDLTKTYTQLNNVLQHYNIRSTPTCIVKYSEKDVRRYAGPEEIKRGLSLLLSTPTPVT